MDRLYFQKALVALALLLPSVPAQGCGDDGIAICRVGADCVSGICLGDGTCAAPGPGIDGIDGTDGTDSASETLSDPDAPDLGGDAATATGDLGETTADTAPPTDATSGTCVPVQDDVITRAEVPLRSGLYATFRIASDAPVDLVGERDGESRTWNLEGPLPGDTDVRVDLLPVTGAWFATDFPGATYAARLSTGNDYLGVFELTDDALLLRGVVSPEAGTFATNLSYDPPVVAYRFPLALGDSWTTSATVTGQTLGVLTYASEQHTSEVDAAGWLETPFGRFAVLRVRTTLVRVVAFVPTTIRQIAFVSPCFGTVALAVSASGESDPEFGTAAEIRRLAP